MHDQILVKIRRIRLEKSFSQEYVANELGITQSQYGKIENGLVKLSYERLQSIAKILETELNTLTTS
jgi:transcriptional regulator with XRE-family HTH domain